MPPSTQPDFNSPIRHIFNDIEYLPTPRDLTNKAENADPLHNHIFPYGYPLTRFDGINCDFRQTNKIEEKCLAMGACTAMESYQVRNRSSWDLSLHHRGQGYLQSCHLVDDYRTTLKYDVRTGSLLGYEPQTVAQDLSITTMGKILTSYNDGILDLLGHNY